MSDNKISDEDAPATVTAIVTAIRLLHKMASFARNHKILTGMAVLFTIIVTISLCSGEDAPQVTSTAVSRADIVEKVPSSGKIRPVSEVKISSDVSGEIVELNCREGDFVAKGELLIKIRQDLYISMVERAEAALNTQKAQYLQQKAQLRKAEAALARCSTMFAFNAISRSEYDNSLAECESAREQLKAAEFGILSGKASVKEAKENLTKTTIYAPMDGTISRLEVEIGERVVGTGQMAGTEMLRIADLSRMEVVSQIGENDITRIHPGDSVTIDVDACPGVKFGGRVTQIANSAKNLGAGIEQVTNFEARISIYPTDDDGPSAAALRPGMSASVSITTADRRNVTSIPISCIFAKDGKEMVWVISEDRRVECREIRTGIQDITTIEIKSGLTDGERVVSGPYAAICKELSEGMKVRTDD